MSHAFPPAKRKRLEPDAPGLSKAESDPTIPHHSKSLWMPYGDIILQAESTQFRVNRDILERNSPVFREMFTTQPEEPTIEGCPIVLLSDAAMDWELLLERLYDYQFQYESALPFDVVAALLRLGRTYDICVAKENALWRIRHEFPAVLDLWDELEAGIRMQKIQYRSTLVLDMLSLAYEGGVSSSVPILAACCLRTFDMVATLLRNEVQRKDGSYVVLSDPMKRALLNASERILELEFELFGWLGDDLVIPHEWCPTSTTCRKRRRELHGMFRMGQGGWRYNALSAWHAESEWGDGLCEVCELAGRTRFNANRHRAWEALPGFFDLPPCQWAELKDLE